MRILAIDTATEACSAALWNDGTLSAHFEICPREHTNVSCPWCRMSSMKAERY